MINQPFWGTPFMKYRHWSLLIAFPRDGRHVPRVIHLSFWIPGPDLLGHWRRRANHSWDLVPVKTKRCPKLEEPIENRIGFDHYDQWWYQHDKWRFWRNFIDLLGASYNQQLWDGCVWRWGMLTTTQNGIWVRNVWWLTTGLWGPPTWRITTDPMWQSLEIPSP